MRRMYRKLAALLTAALLLTEPMTGIGTVYAQSVTEQNGTVKINTVEDFEKFAENCVLDSYSVGKVFVLESDLNLSGTDIKPVPSFGGVFDGNGHTISGLHITDSTSATGLFRYIEQGGTVKNLNVNGITAPSGTAEKCGGIAGVNRGRITDCTFSGVVTGKEMCGGIAGVNESEATISYCSVSGRIQADHFAGGVVGENLGYIRFCENESTVNTNAVDESLELSDINVDELYITEGISDVTDVGGIAGYSSGSVQNCKNTGTVGYPHIGYNIGGIAGRQDGYISGCENYGAIRGRKDVGGIVGQAEPHFMISYSQSNADELKEKLSELNALIDKTINDMDSRGDALSGSFSDVNSTLDGIRSRSDSMMSEAERILNADIDSVNEISSRISDLLDMLSPVTDSVSDSADSLSEGFDKLKEAGELLGNSLEGLDEGTEIIFDSLDDFGNTVTELQNASRAVSDALEALKDGLGDPQKMKDALNALEEDIHAVKFAVNSLSDNVSALLDAIDNFNDSPETESARERIKLALTYISEDSAALSANLDRLSEALKRIGDNINPTYGNTVGGTDDILYDEYGEYLDALKNMIDDGSLRELTEAAAAVMDSVSDLVWDISELSSALSEIVTGSASESFRDDISAVYEQIKNDADYISSITDGSVTAPELDIEKLYSVLDYLENTSDSMTASGDHVKSALDKVKSAWDFLDEAAANAVAASYCASDASGIMSDASESLGSAVDEIGNISRFFAEKSDITFVGADDGFIESREELAAELESLTRELDRLNGSASDMGDIFAQDMRAINDKCSEIKDIIFEIIDEIRDNILEEKNYTEDISESDSQGYAEGKIVSCLNYGEIGGDLNAGGIAGTMGVDNSFDPESDTAETIGERSVSFMYMLRTVVRDCGNYGTVTAKKDGAGGIVGEMSTGCVIGCGGFGDVSSDSGGYVGGVAGNSMSKIVSSSAMCRLSGADHVGGITGKGTDISGCRSFCEITESGEFTGAIAGQCTGELYDNAFVENGSGAVDGISYREKAFPVSYKKMLALSDVPKEFSVMKLLFTADGEIVDILEYAYGDNVSEADIPAIPEKRGCFAKWEDFDKNDLKFGKIINAVYSNLITAVSSDVCRGDGLPVFIVEGSFGGEELRADELKAPNDSESVWSLSIPDDGAQSHIIRYYADEGETDIYVNGEPAEYEKDGRYLVFSTDLKNIEVKAQKKSFDYTMLLYAAGAAAAIIVIIIIAVAVHKKNKKNKGVHENKSKDKPKGKVKNEADNKTEDKTEDDVKDKSEIKI